MINTRVKIRCNKENMMSRHVRVPCRDQLMGQGSRLFMKAINHNERVDAHVDDVLQEE